MKVNLTDSQIEMLRYFWTEKRNLARWSGFENAVPAIPKLVELMYDYDKAHRMITDYIDHLEPNG